MLWEIWQFDIFLASSYDLGYSFKNKVECMTKKIENIDLNKAQPFIKWVGGKRGLLSQIIPLLPKQFNRTL